MSSALERTASLEYALASCVWTVRSLTNSRPAISAAVSPLAARWATSRSRRLSRFDTNRHTTPRPVHFAGEEDLHLGKHLLCITEPQTVIDVRQLDVFRTRKMLCEVARVSDLDPSVTGAMQDEDGQVEHRQLVTHVHRGVHAHYISGHRRARRHAQISGKPGPVPLVVAWNRRSSPPFTGGPGSAHARQEGLQLRRFQAPGVVGAGQAACPGAVEDQRAGPLGVRPGKEQAEGSAFRHSEDRGRARVGGIHYGADVVHPLFHAWNCRYRIGEACASLVEEDEARERGEAGKKPRVAWLFPRDLHVRDEAGHHHQVDRTVADDLMRDADLPALGIPRLWTPEPQCAHACLSSSSWQKYAADAVSSQRPSLLVHHVALLRPSSAEPRIRDQPDQYSASGLGRAVTLAASLRLLLSPHRSRRRLLGTWQGDRNRSAPPAFSPSGTERR